MTKYTGVRLVRRPVGMPVREDFEVVELALPPLAAGDVQVENQFISVDPYMRGRMDGMDTYVTGFELGQVMTGGAVGRVTRSESPYFAVGDLVEHDEGWRTAAVVPAHACRPLRSLHGVSASAYLGILGMTGWTAWVGLREIAKLSPGDRVFVSAASGAVGSAVGQFASLMGASSVIGSTGTTEKANALLQQFGFDHTFNYREGSIAESLRAVAPDGIDVYFDNVGGEHLQAAWDALRNGGRVAVCGAIADYNEDSSPSLSRIIDAVKRRLTIRGFIVYDHAETRSIFEQQASSWIMDGRLQYRETVFEGIERSFDAFDSLFTGEKLGKVVVAVGG